MTSYSDTIHGLTPLFLTFRLYEVVETLGRVHLVTEWVRGGELYHRITQGGPLPEILAAKLYRQLLLAVKHMVSVHNYLFQLFYGFVCWLGKFCIKTVKTVIKSDFT